MQNRLKRGTEWVVVDTLKHNQVRSFHKNMQSAETVAGIEGSQFEVRGIVYSGRPWAICEEVPVCKR